MNITIYLVKLLAFSGIVSTYYWFFLRNRRFHQFNRVFLLAAILLAIILPFITLNLSFAPTLLASDEMFRNLGVAAGQFSESEMIVSGDTLPAFFGFNEVLLLVWGIGGLIGLAKIASILIKLRKISQDSPSQFIDGVQVFITNEPGTPYSFYRSIFWNDAIALDSENGKQIFRHEMYHVRERHTHDIFLLEVVAALLWFNPFFYFFKNELKAVHEFLADEYALDKNEPHDYAEMLVSHAIQTKTIRMTNSFFHNYIKRRIQMITSTKSNRWSSASKFLSFPLLIALVMGFCIRPERAVSEDINNQESLAPLRVVIDAGHGGDNAGAYSRDKKYEEKTIALAIAKKIKSLSSEYQIDIFLTRDADVNPALKERSIFAEQKKADAMISLHIGAASDNSETSPALVDAKSGFDIFIPRKNPGVLENSRKLGSAISQQLASIYQVNPTLLQNEKQGIWVLDASPCPVILVECGYITNEKDLQFILDEKNQEAIARKFLQGLKQYQQSVNK